ncbi:vWA domain-containing protein [Limnoglobus roseus]|uniref:VWA domain-containing protein n=1 Tax=Limnoglobus roseus TaxID=2598579 RepID=A0A5C1A6U6_9BACT|nr:vWA domain-containing protein [Limnoglobus roseus]QEL13973.1 VWA domain-containing protein [Limnoglobus roseus]
MRLFLAGLLLAAFAVPSRADEIAKTKDVDLVVCLDVSGSMNGLIDSAKVRLWDVVNELAKMKPTPNLRVSLYSYGHSTYPASNGYVRKETDLTTDLDEVYAKLNALTINGGEEYVARVTKTALTDQKWSAAKGSLKLIFVCGNEPANQDPLVNLDDAAALAKELGVVVNSIYCGPAKNPESDGWAAFAAKCGGKFATIDQGRVKQAPHVATPYDKDILSSNEKLNKTYVAFGEAGKKGAEKQLAQDSNATANAPGAALGRAEAKAGAAYKNSSWDLVDKMKDDPKFDLAKLKDEELPDELKKLKPADRVEYLKKKGEERCAIQKEIGELSAKRQKHIDAELKKLPKDAGEKALDEALKGIIREQATAKGFAVEEKK